MKRDMVGERVRLTNTEITGVIWRVDKYNRTRFYVKWDPINITYHARYELCPENAPTQPSKEHQWDWDANEWRVPAAATGQEIAAMKAEIDHATGRAAAAAGFNLREYNRRGEDE